MIKGKIKIQYPSWAAIQNFHSLHVTKMTENPGKDSRGRKTGEKRRRKGLVKIYENTASICLPTMTPFFSEVSVLGQFTHSRVKHLLCLTSILVSLNTLLIWHLNLTVWGWSKVTLLVWSMPSVADACHELRDSGNQMNRPLQFIFWFCWLLWLIVKCDKTFLAEDVRPYYRMHIQCLLEGGSTCWGSHTAAGPGAAVTLLLCCWPHPCGHTTNYKIHKWPQVASGEV